MEKYQEESLDLQLKFHGQISTISHNNMVGLFYEEIEKANIDYDDYCVSYQKVTDYYSEGYEDSKDKSDAEFLADVIKDMKRIMEIANMIEKNKS